MSSTTSVEKVKSGLYHTASEVICDALRLLEERDRLYEIRVAEMRREIQRGNEQLARGEVVDGEEVFERIRKKSRARRTLSR